VQRRILAGTAVLSSDRFHSHYEGATNVRGQISKELNAAFNEVDLMVIPTAVTNPPALGPFMQPDSTEAFKNDVMTVPISLAGLPSISIPVLTKDQHRGVGMQIFGPRLSENKVLHAARLLNGL
jgi:aspartyl-tRNA(Asn)/glutamyl-tRNA(Gln) amidotransferase subunit A